MESKDGNLVMILHEIQNRTAMYRVQFHWKVSKETGIPLARITK